MNSLTAARFPPPFALITQISIKAFGFYVYMKTVFVIELSTLCRVGIL